MNDYFGNCPHCARKDLHEHNFIHEMEVSKNYVWITKCPVCGYTLKWYSFNPLDRAKIEASCSPCGHQGNYIIKTIAPSKIEVKRG